MKCTETCLQCDGNGWVISDIIQDALGRKPCPRCGGIGTVPKGYIENDKPKLEAGTSDGSSADYYKLPPGATQLQHLISHKDMNAQLGEIFRAGYRYGEVSHSDKMRDMKKIKYYAEAEIERLEKLVE